MARKLSSDTIWIMRQMALKNAKNYGGRAVGVYPVEG